MKSFEFVMVSAIVLSGASLFLCYWCRFQILDMQFVACFILHVSYCFSSVESDMLHKPVGLNAA